MFALLDSDWAGHGGPALHSIPPAEEQGSGRHHSPT